MWIPITDYRVAAFASLLVTSFYQSLNTTRTFTNKDNDYRIALDTNALLTRVET